MLSVESWRHAHPNYGDMQGWRYNRQITIRFYHCETGFRVEGASIAKVMEKVEAEYRPQPDPSLEETFLAAIGGIIFGDDDA